MLHQKQTFFKNNCGSSQFACHSNNKKQQINNLNKYQNSVLNFTTIKDNSLCFFFIKDNCRSLVSVFNSCLVVPTENCLQDSENLIIFVA